MDKKTEEKISQLAFGELSEREAAEVRELAARQPEGSAVLDAYATMRDDLRRLRDVPPDQLSKERLQNAILAGGLKPKPVRNGISWLWVPSTALTILVGMFLLSKVPLSTPGSIEASSGGNNVSAMVLNDYDISMADQLRKATFTGGVVMGRDETGLNRPVFGEEDATVPAGTAGGSVESAAPDVTRQRFTAKRSYESSQAPNGAIRTLDASPQESVPAHGPLVIIQSGRDMSTGAQSAVEVSQTEDVIVSS
jgi:hypothetical protein